jgi:hypothetical protein
MGIGESSLSAGRELKRGKCPLGAGKDPKNDLDKII